MAGRKQRRPAALSPCVARPRTELPPAGKFGRGLLAPSHAGTRLPIAAGPAGAEPAYCRPGRRALPLRPLPAAQAGAPMCVSVRSSFQKESQKQGGPPVCAPPSKVLYRLPTAALSASGKRVEAFRFLSAFRLPCFSPSGYHRGKNLSRALQREKKRRMIESTTKGESAGAG